jgi:hypothetical protein
VGSIHKWLEKMLQKIEKVGAAYEEPKDAYAPVALFAVYLFRISMFAFTSTYHRGDKR